MASLFSWGLASSGQLGLGDLEEEYILQPRSIRKLQKRDIVQVSSGLRHCLILTQGGNVFSCGANDSGQLGPVSGAGDKTTTPTPVPGLETQSIKLISCGDDFSIAVNSRGQVFSWGKNTFGQAGRTVPESGPKQVCVKLIRQLNNYCVVGVSCGKRHTLAFSRESFLFAWGSNSDGQLGLGDRNITYVDQPCTVNSLSCLPIRQVSAGGCHSFCLSVSRVLFGWGRNSDGQLGLGDTGSRYVPFQIKALRQQEVAYVSCGENHTAILTLSGGLFTFGSASYGQLGHRNRKNALVPTQVTELMGSTVSQVSCGCFHTLVLVPASGCAFAFGFGAQGQLGTGHTEDRELPVIVRGNWTGDGGQRLELDWIASGGNTCFAFGQPRDKSRPPGIRDYHEMFIQTIDCDVVADLRRHPFASGDGWMNEVEAVLSSIPCLIASFVAGEHENPSSKQHGVDLDAVIEMTEKLMESLLKSPDSRQSKQQPMTNLNRVTGALDKLRSEMSARRNFADVECLRVYLILPVTAFFMHPAIFGNLICHFCSFIERLDKAPHEIMQRWLRLLLPRHMKRMIESMKKCVCFFYKLPFSEMLSYVVEDQHPMKLVLKMLTLLYETNVDQKGSLKVPKEAFYIPQVTRDIDIPWDYAKFIQLREETSDRVDESFLYCFCQYIFIFDGIAKMKFLEAGIQHKKHKAETLATNRREMPFVQLFIRRSNLIEDTLHQLEHLTSDDLKKHLRIVFENEEGIDEGGPRKEYFLLLFRDILDPKYGMFKFYEDSRMLWFNPAVLEGKEMYRMIGQICGLAIYNSTLVNLNFPLGLFKKLLNGSPDFDDLKELDPVIGKSLQDLLDYDGSMSIEEVYCLHFEVDEEHLGCTRTVELCHNGSKTPVTMANREEYVAAYVDYVFNRSCNEQFEAFASGFHQLFDNHELHFFEPMELLSLVEGEEEYEWGVFEENTNYEGIFTKDHPVVVWFWETFREMTEAQKKKFLLFLTGSDRVPIVGMSAIKIIIFSLNGGDSYFPVAHTCSSALDLPAFYSSKHVLRDKLLVAIECEGFGLV